MASPLALVAPKQVIVPFDRVPTFRGLAWALQDCRLNGWTGGLISADRRDSTLGWFNRRYGTNLHGQAYLYNGYIHGWAGFLPANPPDRGTHLLLGDGTVGRVHAPLPWWMLGHDVTEWDSLLNVAHKLRYNLVQPYHTGSELHHVCFFSDPSRYAHMRLVKRALRGH